jgi:hypothetical protein
MPSDAPPLPRVLLIGATAAVVLAVGAFGVSGYQALRRSSEPRPARVSILAAVAVLQARELAAQRAARATPAQLAVEPAANMARAPAPVRMAESAVGGVCGLLHTRADHVGQAVAFRGEYLSDHEGPAEVRPLGCDAAIAVSDIEPAVEAAIERADPPPWSGPHRRLIGTFNARLVQSGAEFSYDEGVRLSISGLADLRVSGQTGMRRGTFSRGTRPPPPFTAKGEDPSYY